MNPTTDNPCNRPAIVVVGPTAGGKSSLGVALAQLLPGGGECINADSMQVYRGMDIGTAKTTDAERQGVQHHLLDIADPAQPFTLDDWHGAAEAAVNDIRSRSRWPILVGGTNLYVQAFLFGLFGGPSPDPAYRAHLDGLDAAVLRTQLLEADPVAAERIHPNDRRRTIRALEVARGGTPISSLQTQWCDTPRNDALVLGLQWPVKVINRRINARVSMMKRNGLLNEVTQLAPTLGAQAREALGYKQLLGVVSGDMELAEALEQVKIRTRRFAKHQRTWLRRFARLHGTMWLEAAEKSTQDLANEGLTWILQQPQPEAVKGSPT